MIDCIHPGSCRYCFLSVAPELFDGGCMKDWSDDVFERWAEEAEDQCHAQAVRVFREMEKKRDDFYKRKRH